MEPKKHETTAIDRTLALSLMAVIVGVTGGTLNEFINWWALAGVGAIGVVGVGAVQMFGLYNNNQNN